ncbi:MAG TPA: CHAD domain-containing protein [Steroidobacteraceae bacterium]|nr:CHAD domain-containing protein [Steroidobacteraceae bacterium]
MATRTRTSKRRLAGPELGAGSRRVVEVIAGQQLQVAAAARAAAEAGTEEVHQGRVAARRLRSLLKTFAPLLGTRWVRLYRVDLRSYAHVFTAVREADVVADLLRDLVRTEARFEGPELQRLSVAIEDGRDGARSALRRHLQEPNWAALVAALARHSAETPPLIDRQAGFAEILRLVTDSWRKSLRLLKKSPREVSELHELRLALKHCRYALEAVADLKPQAAARLLRRLREAQDAIGEHRDSMAARHWVGLHARSIGRGATERLTGLLEQREKRLLRRANRRVASVLPAYRRWRRATQALRKEAGRARR